MDANAVFRSDVRACIAQLTKGQTPGLALVARVLGVSQIALENAAQIAYPLSEREIATQLLLRDLKRVLERNAGIAGLDAALGELAAATAGAGPSSLARFLIGPEDREAASRAAGSN